MSGGRIDWPAVRARYVTASDLSLRELAGEYRISLAAVAARSKMERWPQARIDHQNERSAEVVRQVGEEQAKAEVSSITLARHTLRGIVARGAELLKAKALDPSAGDIAGAARLLLLIEGQLPDESLSVNLRTVRGRRIEDLDIKELMDAEREYATELVASPEEGAPAS